MVTAEHTTKHGPFYAQSPVWLHGPPAQEANPEMLSFLINLPSRLPDPHITLSLTDIIPLLPFCAFVSLLLAALSCVHASSTTHPPGNSPGTALYRAYLSLLRLIFSPEFTLAVFALFLWEGRAGGWSYRAMLGCSGVGGQGKVWTTSTYYSCLYLDYFYKKIFI